MKRALHRNAKRRAGGMTKYDVRNLLRWNHLAPFGRSPWAQGKLRATRMPKGGYTIIVRRRAKEGV